MQRPLWSRTASIAVGFAVVWSALLVVAAFTLPVYGTASTTSTSTGSSTTTTGTATLVGVFGPWTLLVVGFPLVLSLLVAWALAARRRRVGWVITGVLCFLTVIALMSIGLFFAPTTFALVVACAATERRRVLRPADDVTAPAA